MNPTPAPEQRSWMACADRFPLTVEVLQEIEERQPEKFNAGPNLELRDSYTRKSCLKTVVFNARHGEIEKEITVNGTSWEHMDTILARKLANAFGGQLIIKKSKLDITETADYILQVPRTDKPTKD
jgi:hypothetical protein